MTLELVTEAPLASAHLSVKGLSPANPRLWWETSELVRVMCLAGEPWVG